MSDTDMNTLFTQVVNENGAAFLKGESALLAQGDTAVEFLRGKQADSGATSLARFIAATLADAIGAGANAYADAMEEIDTMVSECEQTPRGTPTPDSVAGTLKAHSENLSGLAALHLLKETDWPYWKAMGAIVYIGYFGESSALPALQQYSDNLTEEKLSPLSEQANDVIEQLTEAIQLISIVIKNDDFKSALDKVKNAAPQDQASSAEETVIIALSLVTADLERARQLDQATQTIRSLAYDTVLQATKGVVNEKQVREILANYFFGVSDNESVQDVLDMTAPASDATITSDPPKTT